MHKIWNIAKPNLEFQRNLSRQLKVSEVLAQLLINRGITDPERVARFLYPQLSQLIPPDRLPDIDRACQRIKKAKENKEKIMILGDYDVDGITATAVLKSVFKRIGLKVIHHLPHRINEGYGLNEQIIKRAKDEKVKLLVTVDCGTSNYAEVDELNRLNIDVIITDHHQPVREVYPKALALINPKRHDSKYGFRNLSGVGVAYKFAQYITSELLEEDLDLVCLGTIADVVPLVDENRIIAKEGLLMFPRTKRPGLTALIEQSRIRDSLVSAFTVGYILAPRINAGGRIDSAEIPFALLSTQSMAEAKELAKKLGSLNSKRQQIGDKIFKEAQEMIEKEINFKEHKIIVVARPDWHRGVLGIVASRIKEMFHRPAVVISIDDHICKGSARSVNNFHILEAFLECKDILAEFGGHQRAAGLSLVKENIAQFKDKLNQVAKERIVLEDLYPSLDIDMELGFEQLSEDLVNQLESLEPFGEGNPQPVFYSRNLQIKSRPELLNKGVVRFWVTDGQFTYKAIAFNMPELKTRLENHKNFDLVYTLGLDRWYSPHTVELKIQDIRLF